MILRGTRYRLDGLRLAHGCEAGHSLAAQAHEH